MPRGCFVAISALALAGPGWAQTPTTPPPPATDQIAFDSDHAARMTVPVSIDGSGPYNFVVDTGAERTVISRELANRLQLAQGRGARLHSMSEVSDVGTVVIPELRVSRRSVNGINAPALARSHLGADGMLGVDSLQKQRVLFDFEKGQMSVSPSRARLAAEMDGDTIVVKARSRFGRLILADAEVDGIKISVILDTGTQVSIGNEALRKALLKRKKLGPAVPIELVSVTGGKLPADYTQIKEFRVGGVNVNDLPVAFAEAHPFRKLNLSTRPALLLGMDALALFDRVAVDFASRRVQFDMPDLSGLDRRTRLAASAPSRSPVLQ